MIKVKVTSSSTGLTVVPEEVISKNLIFRISEQFINKSNVNKEIQFTFEDNYDYLFIFNHYKNKIKVDKRHVFGFIIDPPFFMNTFYQDTSKMCNLVYTCCNKKYYKDNDNFVSAPSVMFSHLIGKADFYRNNQNFNKAKKLSICVSVSKTPGKSPMYDFRRELVAKILESDLNCDIFGRGWTIPDPRYKGSPDNKAEALLPYEYSIAVENAELDGYISEKLFDCFVCNTVPIYYGTSTVNTIYNPKSFLPLPYTNDISRLIEWLKDLSKSEKGSNLKYKDYVIESKERYYTRYNLYNLIKHSINNVK
jgi:hypothetical protein